MADNPQADPEFEALLGYIQESRGFDFRGYKRTGLRRRIAIRMDASRTESFAAYQAHLEAHPGEFEDLLNTVLINVTSFFRDPDAWDVLRTDVIPDILANADDERLIRVWSVGCASGEEAYSIAMLFAEALGTVDFCKRVKIYATDLDEDALRAARQATYLPRDVEAVPGELLAKYFEHTRNHYIFNRELRRCVIFGRHNVVNDAPISRVDLLVCRNLLIYLEGETQEVVLPRLYYALRGDGFLFLGKAETQLGRSSLFRPVDTKHRIFKRIPQEWRRTTGGGLVTARDNRTETSDSQAQLLETILNEVATAYLVVDTAGQVALANAAARQLLGVAGADIGRPFQDLPVSYRPVDLRGPIDEVLRERRGIRLEHQEFHVSANDTLRLTVEIKPLMRGDGTISGTLLSFTDSTRLHAMQLELMTAQENLENSIEELQSANEELETTNEELQSTNEELQTTNEELQSTNEELETINEEARSSNDEMESANEDLRIKTELSGGAQTSLDNILRSLSVGVVIVDERHVVQGWNGWNENTWGLRAEQVIGVNFEALDIGFPVGKLRDNVLAVESRREPATMQVLEGVDRRGRRILCRVRVFPLLAEDGSTPVSTVVAFEDVTAERLQEEHARYLGRIMGRALNEVYFLDPQTLRFVLGNKGAEVKLECTLEQLTQMTLPDVLPGVTAEDVRSLLAPLLAGDRQEVVFKATVRSVAGREYPAEINMQFFADEVPPVLVAVVHDIGNRTRPAGN